MFMARNMAIGLRKNNDAAWSILGTYCALSAAITLPRRGANHRCDRTRFFRFVLDLCCRPSFISAAQAGAKCPVNQDQLMKALKGSVKASGGPGNGGLDNNMWAAVVARDGVV
jgi:hypothetical protein